MGYKKCSICELNYYNDEIEDMCKICKEKKEGVSGNSGTKPQVKHKGRNIFWVFQGKEYLDELRKGYIWAPMKDANGNCPSHWAMLENVHEGDIIFHGVSHGIIAISNASSAWFESKIKDGTTSGRQVNCNTLVISNPAISSSFRNEIISTCSKFKYQPFDKNGNGRQGYFFDLNDELAGIFARELNGKNSNLVNQIQGFSDLLKL